MPDTKISALTSLTGAGAAQDDLLAIVDTSAATTKKITREEFFKSVDYISFDTTNGVAAPTEGQLTWDTAEKTLSLGLNGGNTVLQVGQETHYRVHNNTGAQIPDGTVVRFSGVLGSSGIITVAPALADGTYPSSYIIGVTTENISHGADGLVAAFGKVRGIDTSAFAVGDILYASPTVAGGFTKTRPSGSQNIVSVAAVLSSGVNNGIVFVRPHVEEENQNFATRASLVSAISNGFIPVNGETYFAGGLSYLGKTGATTIPDLPGLIPNGDVTPDHWAENTTPGTTDMRAAIASASANAGQLNLLNQVYAVGSDIILSNRVVFNGGARIKALNGATVTINGAIISGDKAQIFEWDGTGAFLLQAQPLVSVAWFGASPSSTVDCAAGVQKAHDSIGNGQIYFPPGTYTCGKVTFNKNNIKVFGSNPQNTIIRKAALGDYLFVFEPTDPATAANNILGVEVSDLSFATEAGSVHTAGAFIKLDRVRRGSIRRIRLQSPYNGIEAIAPRDYVFDSIDAQSNGLEAFNGQRGLWIRPSDAPSTENAANTSITNCVIRNPSTFGTVGMNVGIEFGAADGVWLTNNYIGSMRTNSIKIAPESSTRQVSGLRFSNCWFDPIQGSGSNVLISGDTSGAMGIYSFNNCCINGGGTADRGIDVTVSGSSVVTGLTVKGCNFNNHLHESIYIRPGTGGQVRYVNITGNTLRGAHRNGTTSAGVIRINPTGTMRGAVISGNQAGWFQGFGDTETVGLSNYGLQVSGDVNRLTVVGNDFTGNVIGAMLDISTGANRMFSRNLSDENRVLPSAATLVLNNSLEYAEVSGTTTINNMTIRAVGQTVTLRFQSSLTISGSGNLKTWSGGTAAEMIVQAGQIVSWISDGSNWIPMNGAAILSTGEDANGRWVRYANGWQVCSARLTLNAAINVSMVGGFRNTGQTWVYPKLFKSGELPVITAIAGAFTSTSVITNSATNAGASIFHTAVTSQAAADLVAHVKAEGWWL